MLNFVLPKFFIRKKCCRGKACSLLQAVASLETRAAHRVREARGRYQQSDLKVIAAGFVFALETLVF
jgi:hypothetical protein